MKIQDSPGVLNEYQRDDLILRNLHLVNVVAKEYRFVDHNKYEDLIQEGRLGLIKAAEKFDPLNGLKFETYAVYNIRYNIQDYLRKESTLIHIPHNRLCKAYRLLRFINTHIQKNNGTPPSRDEMKGFLCCNEDYLDDIVFIIEILGNQFEKLEEIKIIKKNQTHNKILLETIFSFIELLSNKEKIVIKEKYFENRSFRSIGEKLNISHEMVRKIHNSAIKRIKNMAIMLKE